MASSVLARNERELKILTIQQYSNATISMKKMVVLDEAINISKRLKSQGKTIVLAGGCFDVLHKGHYTFLTKAKMQGDILIIALESDENVKKLKGEERPINTQLHRAGTLAALAIVDYVLLLPQFTYNREYFNMTNAILPHTIAITEGDPKKNEKQKQATAVGAKLISVTKRLEEFSTTQMLSHQ